MSNCDWTTREKATLLHLVSVHGKNWKLLASDMKNVLKASNDHRIVPLSCERAYNDLLVTELQKYSRRI